jgi:hypothetical protein
MYSQAQIEALALLDKYFSETSEAKVKAEIQAVTELSFVGSSAKDYFDLFHKSLNYEPFKSSLQSSHVMIKSKLPIEYSMLKMNKGNNAVGIASKFLYFKQKKSDFMAVKDYNTVQISKKTLVYLKENSSNFNSIYA